MVTGWFEIATQLTEAESTHPQNEEGQTWLSVFAKDTKNNPNMLRRMQRAKDFINKNFNKKDIESLSRLPLSYVDVLSRAYSIDRYAAIELAKLILYSGEAVTYRSLLARYEKIRQNDSKVRNASVPHKSGVFFFKKRCFEIAKNGGMNKIYNEILSYRGGLRFRIWKGGHAFVSPYMTCRLDADEASQLRDSGDIYYIDAFDCFTQYKGESSDIARDRILKAASEATFFTRLWIMLPAEQDDIYERLLGKLGPNNLGIIRIDVDLEICRCTLVPKQAPMPDRRSLWNNGELKYTAR
jgi:hypothetical protein